jgi:hypothetical protein
MSDAYQFHRLILELCPAYLSLSPLDVDYVELMFGFDLDCKEDQDTVVYEALFANSPLANLLHFDTGQGKILDVQPVMGCALTDSGNLQAYFEVKTRQKTRRGSSKAFRGEPISLFLTLRQYGPIDELGDLPTQVFDALSEHAEHLATDKLVPDLLTPISRHITNASS